MTIVGAPLDLGQGRRGVDMGPSAIRYAGLEERLASFGCTVVDRGNVSAPEPEALAVRDERARFLPEILEACARLGALVQDVVSEGSVPLVLGGDHSIAIGTLAGLRERRRRAGRRRLDRRARRPQPAGHEPLGERPRNAPRRLSRPGGGRIRPPRAGTARRSTRERVVLVGVRSLDPAERTLIKERGIRAITMTEIDRIGIERAMQEAIDRVSGAGFVHVSLDLDALDPEIAPGVGTPVKGGLTYREAHLACELLAEAGLVGSLELVEVNPILDRENGSAAIAVELAASALGQSIL